MDLPFELYKKHKQITKYRWRKKGLNIDNFEEIYERYIYATKCELCDKEFMKPTARHMEHDHNTGEFRNIVCSKCNQRKSDVKDRKDNTSGHRYIHKNKDKTCKQGFIWILQVQIEGKRKNIKQSVDLEKLIKFRDKWFEEHPDYFT